MKNLPDGFTRYDTADYLNTEAEIAEYLKACAEYDDPKLMLNALNVIASVSNKAELARDVRGSLYINDKSQQPRVRNQPT